MFRLRKIFQTSILLPGVIWAASAEPLAPSSLTDAEQAAVFEAAGMSFDKVWRACDTGDTGAATEPARIQELRDLNGDGRPEALVMEGGLFCYGHAGVGFFLVSKQGDGSWRLVIRGIGIPEFLGTPGSGGWPDISIGGPGFCFPIVRWNGNEYALHRFEYQGEPCSLKY